MGATNADAGADESTEGLIEAFLVSFVGGEPDRISDLVTDDCVLHQVRWPRDTEGRAAIVEATRGNAGTLVDVSMTVEESVLAGDRVAAYVTASGRNVGPLGMGDQEIAPTGRTFEIPQFGLYRVRDGKVAEAWILADALGLVEQLDNLPTGPVKMAAIALRQLRWRLGGRKRLN